jgi:thiol:disulfide interchange protein
MASFPLASLDPVIATLGLSALVLLAGTMLCFKALDSDKPDIAKQVFAVVGVLFGLLAAGGLGTLFAHSTAETAENAASSAGKAAANSVSGEVGEVAAKVEELKEESGKEAGGKKPSG